MRGSLAANLRHLSPASAQISADNMPNVEDGANSSAIAQTAAPAQPANVRRRMSWTSIKRNESNGNEQSLKSLINAAGVDNVTEYSGSLPSSNEGQLDQIIPNFVSKQVRRVCYQMCAEVALKSDNGSQEPLATPLLTPTATEAFAAVVMVDVSGYSKLTAVLAERGPVGAELLTKTMKGYLDKIIQTIVTHGGDIVKFAGDAVIFCWKSEKATNLTDASQDKIRGELVYKASHCCLKLLTKLGTYDIDIEDCPTKTLRIHLGIGSGLIYDVLVGGDPGRWEHFIAGDGVNQLSQVLDLAKAGELALSHQALKWLSCVIDIATVNLGDYDKRCIILTGLEKAERKGHAPPDAEDEIIFKDARQMEANVDLYRNFVDRTALFKLQADINQSRLFQMESGLMDLLNLTELRQVTTIFIKVGSLQVVHRNDILDESQRAIMIVQTALHRCEGSLRQFHVDDKGAVILCFFGLPPLAHENDAGLGIKAGLEIRDKFLDIFDDFSIGITTGVVSYGGVGAPGRAEYAVMGDAINMAARLMCHAEATEGILCDEKTYNLCESDFIFENLGETKVKGKNSAISIFRPNGPVPEASKNKTKSIKTSDGLKVIGREKERKCMIDALDRAQVEDVADAILIQADGGQGLSTLVSFAKNESVHRECQISISDNAEIEKSTSYYAWQSIIHDLVSFIEAGSYNESNQFIVPPPMSSNPNLTGGTSPAISPLLMGDSFTSPALASPMLKSPTTSSIAASLTQAAATVSPGTTVAASPGQILEEEEDVEVDEKKSTSQNDLDKSQISAQERVSETTTPITPSVLAIPNNPHLARLKLPSMTSSGENKGSAEIGSNSPKVMSPGISGSPGGPLTPSSSVPASNGLPPLQSHPTTRPRRMSVMKVDSDEYLDDGGLKPPSGGTMGRLRHPVPLPVSPETPLEQSTRSTSFQMRVLAALEKLNENAQAAMLFDIIVPPENQEPDPENQNPSPLRTRELSNLVTRVINTITVSNKMLIMINEAQWMDTMSWELLYQVLMTCPKVVVFIFTRPDASYENKENRAILRRIENIPRTKMLMVGGLSMEETRLLIIASWTGHAIKNVSPKIVDSIYKRTDGNPFFIRSLTVAMKNSGQWRINTEGVLTTQNGDFDFEQLVLGYDNQSIILAQFDRLDRNFQLFLKVAAVLGQKFLLDDVLFFLTGMPNASERMDRKNYALIIRAVQSTDKYGFLQKETASSDGIYFHFKSVVVRKCIYSMMVHKQRQRLHQNVGVYYESRLNESNRHKYLVPIYEHFMEADESQTSKKLHYLEMVASYNYERGSMSECIRHYKQLLEIAGVFRKGLPQGTDFKKLTVANWYRELGHAQFLRDSLSDAEKSLNEALRMYGAPLPDSNFKLMWEIRKQLRIRKKREAAFFQHFELSQQRNAKRNENKSRDGGADKSEYAQSYLPPKSLSSYSLTNHVSIPPNRLDAIAGAQAAPSSSGTNGNWLTVNMAHSAGGGGANTAAGNYAGLIHNSGGGGGSSSANSSANAIMLMGGQFGGAGPYIANAHSHTPSTDAEAANMYGGITALTSTTNSRFSQNLSLLTAKQPTKDRNASQSLVREAGTVRYSAVQGIQHVLIVLAELYARAGDFPKHQLCVLIGLNMEQQEIQENMLARFFSFGSMMLWTAQIRPHMAFTYLDAADKLDTRAEISTSIQIVSNQSVLLFVMGRWDHALKSFESLCYLTTIAGDAASLIRGLIKRTFVQYCGVSRTLALATHKELVTVSKQKESFYGRFCGYYFSIMLLMASSDDIKQPLTEMMKQFDELSESRKTTEVAFFMINTTYVAIRALVRAQLEGTFNLQKDLAEYVELMGKVKMYQWNVMFSTIPMVLVLFMAFERGALEDPKTRHFIVTLCAKTNAALKQIKCLGYSGPIRCIFKGMRLMLLKQKDKAIEAWTKGLDPISEVVLLQAIINFAISRYGGDSTQCQEAGERTKHTINKLQVSSLFKKIWGPV